MRATNALVLAGVIATAGIFVPTGRLAAYPGGIVGRTLKGTTPGCSCHGSQSASITVLIKAPSALLVNQAARCTVTVSGSATGVNIAASQGTFSAVSSSLRLLNGELTQNAATTPGTFIFNYTAPSSPGTQTLYATGVAGYPGNWNHATNRTISVTAATPPVPALLLPANGAAGQPTSLTLSWSSSSGATGYHLQLATDSLFTAIVRDDSTLAATSTLVSGLAEATTYFWRVHASNASGSSAYSSVWRFRTLDPVPATPTLLFPGNGTVGLPLAVTFAWAAIPAASSYRLQVTTDSLFGGGWVLDDSSLADTFRTVANLLPATSYFWRARARNSSGSSAWSAGWSFSTLSLSTHSYAYIDGWNLVSVSMEIQDMRATSLFPPAVSPPYGYDQTGGYIRRDTLSNGTGYWLKFSGPQTVSMTGVERLADTLVVQAGWNLIGSVAAPVPVDSIVQIPASIVQSAYFGFLGGYTPADTLQPGKAYWVKITPPGRLVLR